MSSRLEWKRLFDPLLRGRTFLELLELLVAPVFVLLICNTVVILRDKIYVLVAL